MTHDPGGPEHGHLFRIIVTGRMTSRVVGDPTYYESDWEAEPWTLEVRAWSLKEAMAKAALHELADWTPPYEIEGEGS